jgi:UDP-N-acetylmuramyl pentapeptide phosphotransferase/UDP-N-acetylglucosamine-1-phosphate transferase
MKVFFLNHSITLWSCFLLAFVISYLSVRPIVDLCLAKGLVDVPNGRTSHKKPTATLGGIAIFAGFMLSVMIFSPYGSILELRFITAGTLIMFFVGVKDDIFVISPFNKLVAQIIAAIILIDFAGIRLTSLHGFMGIKDIDYYTSLYLTIFVVVVIINAFNLIDGIDGLAAGIGIVVSITFGLWFFYSGQYEFANLTAALVGALIGFIIFNIWGKEKKIFMGDTGSLILGFLVAVFAIQFNQSNLKITGPMHISASPAVSFAVLIIPLYDTLRVFIARLCRKQSPFKADRGHMHHKLLELGYSHLKATTILVITNIFFIILAYFLNRYGIILMMIVIITLATILSYIPVLILKKRGKSITLCGKEV